jgi:hypothetical protein
MTNFHIHISDVQAFKKCRRFWDYSSRLRKGLEPRRMYAPFFTGRALHAALEAWHTGKGDLFATAENFIAHSRDELKAGGYWERQQTEFNEQAALVRAMLSNYLEWCAYYKGEYANDELEFIATEVDFNVPLRSPTNPRTDITFSGRFDGLVKHKPTNTVWVWETKSTANVDMYINGLDRHEQATAYTIAAGYVLKQPVAGVLFNIVRKKAMPETNVLKDGTLSKAKTSDIPARVYLNRIREHHKDDLDIIARDTRALLGEGIEQPEELVEKEVKLAQDKWIKRMYGETLEALVEADRQYVARIPLVKTPEEKKTFLKELWQVAIDMVNPNIPIYRNESDWNCQRCLYKSPCAANKLGADEDLIVNLDYQPRTYEAHALSVEE